MKEGSVDAKSMAGYFSANTLRGDIHAEMTDNRWRGYEFAAMTQSGSVELKIPTDFSAALQLETRNGKTAMIRPIVEGDSASGNHYQQNRAPLTASVGDGGAPIKISTASEMKLLKNDGGIAASLLFTRKNENLIHANYRRINAESYQQAKLSRLRKNFNFHRDYADPINRC
jgi:hypothetical protein